MNDIVITLQRVFCDEVTDDFLEGLTDEFGFRLCGFDAAGDRVFLVEQIPMPGMEVVEAGSTHELNRELGRLGPENHSAELEFWEKDTFSADDLLGRILVRRGGAGLQVQAGESATDLGGGCYLLKCGQGEYKVWLDIREA
jgi:hypothetical protein